MSNKVGRMTSKTMYARVLGIAAVLSCASLAGAGAEATDAARLARADAVVRAEMRVERIPGLAIAIVDHGRVVLARGYGYANVEHSVPVTVDTVFQSGSVGKQFTAAAVMLLAEDGRLSLDDPVTRYLPEAPPGWSAIRIRHLLTHTAGIPDYRTEALPADMRRSYTEQELVRMVCASKLEFPPGERFSYSNPGYLLLGAIIGRVVGRHYSDVLGERVFRPLGMKSAREIDDADIVMHRAAGYRLRDGQLANQEWMAPENNKTADGSLYLSISDMIAWDRGLREGKILSAESWRTVFTPVRLNSGRAYPYGFGWNVETLAGQTVESHSGGSQGFETYISRYLGDDLSIIVLTNLAVGDPARIARHVAAVLSDRLALPARTPIGDSEPARRVELERLLRVGRAGGLTAADLPHVRGGFLPDVPAAYRSTLEELGDLKTLSLVARSPLGDDERSEYLADFANGRRVVVYSVDPQGRTSDLDISEPD
jgi:CubicO group peptidase (beta-lactamase class C family)